jgi:hypothetical protein
MVLFLVFCWREDSCRYLEGFLARVKGLPYARTYYDQHRGYREESRKEYVKGKTGKGHPKTLDGEQEQCPDEQCLRQAVDDRNRLETAAFGVSVIQVHGLLNCQISRSVTDTR